MIAGLMIVALVAPQDQASHYDVRLEDPRQLIRVTATLPAGTTRLFMDSVQASHLPRGWASHVRDLSVRAAGRIVAATPDSPAASWRLPSGLRGPLTVSYAVDLAFTQTNWSAGNEQAGASFDDALYLVGRALFITGDISDRASVRFALPDGWHVSTPLPRDRVGGGYRAANATELMRNALVLGRHASVLVGQDSFQLELALPGATRAAAPLAEAAVRAILPRYLQLFPGTPSSRYLMVFFNHAADDGESFLNSSGFTTTDSVTAQSLIVWGNFLAHELMHFWNGQRLRGAQNRTTWRWLAEGFSEYYANVMLARTAQISSDLFLKKVERHLGNYLYFATAPALTRMSLVDAGTNTSANRFGVYDGGWTVAFCLDGLIRERSGDRRSLDDFMRELWRRFGAAGRGYTPTDLAALADELGGAGTGALLTDATQTRETLPVRECLRRVGLSAAIKGYAAEAFVSADPAATPAARARGAAMFGAAR